MLPLEDRIHLIDLEYAGQREVIAVGVLEVNEGVVLVDPGPTVGLEALRRSLGGHGLDIGDVVAVLATHIHLDHTGGVGVLVRENPALRVYVHERGARHLVDPRRLLESAARLYGDRMAQLWGEVVPVAEGAIVALAGGETIRPGGRAIRVAYTPGHAWHHVSYLDEESRYAFVGDTAGERFPGFDFAIPVTPPPDIDLESWRRSLDALRAWSPRALFLTHFGPVSDPIDHLDRLEAELERWAGQVRASLAGGEPDDVLARRFEADVFRDLAARIGAERAERYREAAVRDSWYGLARYWRKREAARTR